MPDPQQMDKRLFTEGRTNIGLRRTVRGTVQRACPDIMTSLSTRSLTLDDRGHLTKGIVFSLPGVHHAKCRSRSSKPVQSWRRRSWGRNKETHVQPLLRSPEQLRLVLLCATHLLLNHMLYSLFCHQKS